MKYNVYAWYGQPLPVGLKEGWQELSDAEVMKLFHDGNDLMLHHHQLDSPRGKTPKDGVPLLAISPKYMGFKQR